MAAKEIKSDEELIDKNMIAKHLGMSVPWIAVAIKKHGLPHYKIGKSLRFKISEVDLWLKQRRVN